MIFRRDQFERPPLLAALRAWLRQHAYSLLYSTGSLLRQPLAASLTCLVLALALALPLGLRTSLLNLSHLGGDWQGLERVTVFLLPETSSAAATALADEVATWEGVNAVDSVSPEQALAEFREATGFGAALDELPENPLPYVLVVEPETLASGESALRQLLLRLQQQPAVDFAQADLAWLRRLDSLLALGRGLVRILSVLFAFGIIFVVANTVRVEVQARRDEVDVLALAGATPAFIRRPFLYTGLWYGLCGGILAWGMTAVGIFLLQPAVSRLAESYSTQLQLTLAPWWEILLLVIGSAALGLLGAWLAVSRQLHSMQRAGN
ncbi:MAG: permease-like cell division protein FtsX [Wenzhouxiangellaceae bacterium]